MLRTPRKKKKLNKANLILIHPVSLKYFCLEKFSTPTREKRIYPWNQYQSGRCDTTRVMKPDKHHIIM